MSQTVSLVLRDAVSFWSISLCPRIQRGDTKDHRGRSNDMRGGEIHLSGLIEYQHQ